MTFRWIVFDHSLHVYRPRARALRMLPWALAVFILDGHSALSAVTGGIESREEISYIRAIITLVCLLARSLPTGVNRLWNYGLRVFHICNCAGSSKQAWFPSSLYVC